MRPPHARKQSACRGLARYTQLAQKDAVKKLRESLRGKMIVRYRFV
jgi:hypothetical protein